MRSSSAATHRATLALMLSLQRAIGRDVNPARARQAEMTSRYPRTCTHGLISPRGSPSLDPCPRWSNARTARPCAWKHSAYRSMTIGTVAENPCAMTTTGAAIDSGRYSRPRSVAPSDWNSMAWWCGVVVESRDVPESSRAARMVTTMQSPFHPRGLAPRTGAHPSLACRRCVERSRRVELSRRGGPPIGVPDGVADLVPDVGR